MIDNTKLQDENNKLQQKRSICVFISSTLCGMIEERDVLITLTWPQLRQFCKGRYVELVEAVLRCGISDEQSIRKETGSKAGYKNCQAIKYFI